MFLVLCGNSDLDVLINFVLIKKNFAKRDTRPLKGRDLTINVHQGGIPKNRIIEKIGVSEKISLAGNIFLRGWG